MNTKTPVLVIGFNRPDLLSQVLNDINLFYRRVYISIDGPRNSSDSIVVHECIELAAKFKSRHPDCFIRVSQKNSGCKLGVSGAIDWVFNYENEVIILEDDVVPNDFFYVFMDEMLQVHRENHNVWQISGHCALPVDLESTKIYLSHFPQIWGWSTWKNRWEKYDRNLEHWTGAFNLNSSDSIFPDKSGELKKFWTKRLNECKSGLDTWDYQWVYSMWANAAMSISPGQSLCANQGFDERATHTKISDSKQRNRLISTSAFVDLTQNPEINLQLDAVIAYVSYGIRPPRDNFFYKNIRDADRKASLQRILRLRNPILLAKHLFWTAWRVLQIYKILNTLGIWKILLQIKNLLIKPRH